MQLKMVVLGRTNLLLSGEIILTSSGNIYQLYSKVKTLKQHFKIQVSYLQRDNRGVVFLTDS